MAWWPRRPIAQAETTLHGRLATADWQGIGLGLLGLAAVVFAELLVGGSASLTALYAFAPLAAAASGGVRATAAVGLAALVLALTAEAWSVSLGEGEGVIAIAAVVAGGAVAVVVARAREQARRSVERLRVLNEIAVLAGSSGSVAETLRAVESALVPSFADFCIIDRQHDGPSAGVESRRYLIGGRGGARQFKRKLIERSTPAVPGGSTTAGEAAKGEGDTAARLVSEVRDADLEELAFDGDDLELLRSLGVTSMIRAPLRSRGQRLGVVTMATAWSSRRYFPGDDEFALALGGRIALALDNSGLYRELKSVETWMETAMAVLDEAVVIHDEDGSLVFANPASAKLLGFEDPSELVGITGDAFRDWCRIYDEEGSPVEFEGLSDLLSRAGEQPEPPIVRVQFLADRRDIWIRARVRAVPGQAGSPQFTVTALEDLTEIKRGEQEQSLLARTGELLSWSNDYEAILTGLAELAIPSLADYCTVDLLQADGSLRRVAASRRDPGRPGSTPPPDSRLELDLMVGGERSGVVTLGNEPGRRPLADADRRLAEKVLERAGAALENARLAAERAEIASGLQQGLIPPPLPEIPGWEIAAHYRPAGEEADVGGDFYEAFRIKSGWMIVIGDVTGRGPRAASITAQARYTLRTAGILSRSPRAALAALNRALLARRESPLCSAAIVVLHEGSDRADVAVAGHPPPLRVEPAGEVLEIGAPGPVLGAFEGSDWPVESFVIGQGRQLVLHTDGVTEAAYGSDRFGDERLHEALLSASAPADILTRVETELIAFCHGRLRDDVALVAITPEMAMEATEDPEVELVRSFYSALESRRVDQMAELCDERFELEVPEVALSGRSTAYRGKPGVRRWIEDLGEAWEDLILTPRQFGRAGANVVARGRVYARSRPLGIRDVPMVWMWEVRDGRLLSCRSHADLEGAHGFGGGVQGSESRRSAGHTE